jgi:O-antigen ligase
VEFIDNRGTLHLNLITGLMCIAALLATGNLPKMLISKQGRWISLFSFCIFAGLPFSTWKGGSIGDFTGIWLKSFVTFFFVGGLISSIKQFRTMTVILAFSTVSQIYLAFRGGVQADDRLTMSYGSLGNSNDLATALLIGFPFMAFAITERTLNPIIRAILAVLSPLLLIAVLKTGSRAGVVVIGVLIVFIFTQVTASNKLKMMVAVVFIVGIFAATVPSNLRNRYMTIFSSKVTSAEAESAQESTGARKGLLMNALLLTIRHPVFGVGLGQFAPQSFNLFVSRGLPGLWYTCHDIFALVAAEIGVPGVICFLALIYSSFRSLHRLSKIPKTTPELDLISRMAFTVFTSLLAFVACGVFNTQAYGHQLPVLASLAAALDRLALPHIAASVEAKDQASRPAFQPSRVPAYANRRLAPPPARATL